MIGTNNISVRFGQRTLYKEVNIKFTNGNCYGLIGANGAGKSTFLRVLSGDLQPDTGEVYMGNRETLFTLKQDHFSHEEEKVLNVVLRGNERLYAIMEEKDALYSKTDFT
ncbi:MAG: ATP-binding cassette domain-containing protein, partial [Longicatena sp.]